MCNPTSRLVHILYESFPVGDLGVQMKSNLKWNDQCRLTAIRSKTALVTIHKKFKLIYAKMLSSLNKTWQIFENAVRGVLTIARASSV